MERNMIKVLHVLNRAACCCPLGYISLHTNILSPLTTLEYLEELGYVHRIENENQSPSYNPMFKISHKGQQVLYKRVFEPIDLPLTVITEKYA